MPLVWFVHAQHNNLLQSSGLHRKRHYSHVRIVALETSAVCPFCLAYGLFNSIHGECFRPLPMLFSVCMNKYCAHRSLHCILHVALFPGTNARTVLMYILCKTGIYSNCFPGQKCSLHHTHVELFVIMVIVDDFQMHKFV